MVGMVNEVKLPAKFQIFGLGCTALFVTEQLIYFLMVLVTAYSERDQIKM